MPGAPPENRPDPRTAGEYLCSVTRCKSEPAVRAAPGLRAARTVRDPAEAIGR
ncbi:hypothetical protein CLV72_10414 [Allonocardiopsis opalescens]|uniref:Uncharacterized protein n=1 Tax=Allonocardiopsis opalescens TaxID=1144618 RepID=A0A2T0Q3Q1_9ACTN|nr:hypothetical protein CLV72_10414 [Allonocardiopsis opalescens]